MRNFPIAAKSVKRNLATQELKTAEYNELRFMSRRPFNLNAETRDNRNEHIVRHPDEQMSLPTPVEPRNLRGYLNTKDY